MFKVECLGCQAPYQVDERRVPEKGLKMRCPKCGTSFKVEPPAQGTPQTRAPAPSPEATAAAVVEPAPKAFMTASIPAGARLGKPPGGREGLARTMIGVSSADLDLLTSKAAAPTASKPKPFRIPRPNEPSSEAEGPVLLADTRGAVRADEPPAFETDLPSPALRDKPLSFAARSAAERADAELPAVFGQFGGRPAERVPVEEVQAVLPSAVPGADVPWMAEEALSDAVPESLAEPSSPLSLSELPQPVAGPLSNLPELPRQRSTAKASALELDFGSDLPIIAPPVRRPPPRRPRAAQSESKPPKEDTLDLPARLEDLEAGLPALEAVPAEPSPTARRPPPRPKPSSLDGLDLPSVVARESIAPELPLTRAPTREKPRPAAAFAELPSVMALEEEAPGLSNLDLPAVGYGASPFSSAQLPALRNDLPDVLVAGLPDVQAAGLPDILSAGLPALPNADLPGILNAGLPSLSGVGLPEVTAQGVSGFGRIDLPVAREAGLPEVRGAGVGLVEMDLPGVGEILPALSHPGSWDEANLPLVGESLPSAKGRVSPTQAEGSAFQRTVALPSRDSTPFGDFGPDAEGDPFAGSEADFGAPLEGASPFGAEDSDPFGETAAEFGSAEGEPARARARNAAAGYGEVDIAGDAAGSDSLLETADDMEFQAIPQQESAPPGRAAASASVHADAPDVDATGSTLELGPERKAPRARTRRMAVVMAICATGIAGGALALKPALGPFGIHFILDQVKRGEHERLLQKLVVDARQAADRDTLVAARRGLASLEAAREIAPRFEPLMARSALAHYDAVLRFGPLPKLEATADAALAQLDPESDELDHRLARAAHAAVARASGAKAALEALGNDPDARALLGELTLRDRDWAGAVNVWTELEKGQPEGVRAAFGLARAELGLGQASLALAGAERVLSSNPEHVGAPIVMLDAQRALQNASDRSAPESSGTEKLVALVKGVLPQASPGEAALAQSVLGELHLNQGRIGPAQLAFEESLAIDSNFPRALVGLGETLHLSGRYSEALARFEAAAHAEPNSLYAELGIAKSQIQLARLPEAKAVLARLEGSHKGHPGVIFWMGKAEQALGNSDAALAAYRASIDAAKGRADSVDAYLALAKLQSELGQLALAQKTLSEARDRLPPSGPLHKALGEVAMDRAEFAEAYAHFQKAVGLESGDTRARFMGAVALTRMGRFQEALSAFETVGETDKDFPGLSVERGRLFEESGRTAEALKEYEAAFAKSAEDPDLWIRVGCARVAAGQGAAAEDLLEKALKARQRSAEANYCLGRALFDQERYVDAIARLERAQSLDGTRAIYSLYVGWVSAEVGRQSDAEVALDNAIELDKGLGDAFWQRGRLRLKQGAVKDAISDLQRALELKPARSEALADLAVAYADLGRMPKALDTWEEAIARDADNPTWHFRYGKLLSSSGNGVLSVAHLRRALDLVNESEGVVPDARKQKPPLWLWQAHYLLGRELGAVPAAIPHWQAYLRMAPPDDPYRPEAERALQSLGQPWAPR